MFLLMFEFMRHILFFFILLTVIPAGLFAMSNNVSIEPTIPENAKKILIAPDEKSFLYYLSEWTPNDRFPIFIGKNKFVDKFASVYNGGNNYFEYADTRDMGKITRSSVYRSLCASFSKKNMDDFSGETSKSDLKKYFDLNELIPEGIVLTNIDSSKLPAAFGACFVS